MISSRRGWIALQMEVRLGRGMRLRWAVSSGSEVAPCLRPGLRCSSASAWVRGVDDGDGAKFYGRVGFVGAASVDIVALGGEFVGDGRGVFGVGCSRERWLGRGRVAFGSAEKMRDFFERALRGRETNALQGRPVSASRRSRESARCAPRLVGTSAWISSMMTVSTVRACGGLRGEQQIERFRRGDEDFGGMSAGSVRARLCGVSPVRTADFRCVRTATPCWAAMCAIPASGAQIAFDIDGEGFERADVDDAAAGFGFLLIDLRGGAISVGAANMSRSRHQRKAVRVLPVPVGARMSVFSPRAMAGQPSRCAAVGRSKTARTIAR